MDFKRISNYDHHDTHLHFTFLFCLWFIGLLIGISFAYSFDAYSSFPIDRLFTQDTSLVVIFASVFIPISFVLIAFNSPYFFICYPILFIEAISRGFTGFFLFVAFGSSAWLLRILVLFTGNVSVILLWFFLIERLRDPSYVRLKNLSFIFLLSIVIVFINHFLISDFLHTIF